MGKEDTSGRVGIIEAVKTPLGFFTLACLVVEASLGLLALQLAAGPQLVAVWGMIGTLILLILVVAVIATFRPQALGVGLAVSPRADVDIFCGAWWELIPNDANIAVSYFEIMADASSELHLEGTTYNRAGIRVADWRSQGACLNYATRELFYFWTGDERLNDTFDKDFSGVGYLYFSRSKHLSLTDGGAGWVTLGNIREAKLEGKRKVDIQRISEGEQRLITDDESKAKTALSVYQRWIKTLPKQDGPELDVRQ
jgi:hypothetical protein